LGAFAALFGKPFAPFSVARVLEIGCGEGANLLSMAVGAPNAHFVGVDLAERPIAVARSAAQACGLANVRFHVQDIRHLDAALGEFDYIIAHGVYAWVPESVRVAVMRCVGALLSAEGMAMISYNAHPGSRRRQALRDILLHQTKDVDDPSEKLSLARSCLTDHIASWSDADPFEHAMILEARRALDRAPEALFHDELTDFYEPQLLCDVIAAAREVGLDYLCDAKPQLSTEAFFPSEIFDSLRERAAGDWGRFEQLLDFRDMCSFRNSIFCRGGVIRGALEPQRMRGLWASGELYRSDPKADAPDASVFKSANAAEIATNNPKLAQFLSEIADAFPSSVSLDAITEYRDLFDNVLQLFVTQVVQIRTARFLFATTPGERPIVSPFARFQAASGETNLATLRQASVRIEDALTLGLIALLDGTRTREELAREIAARAGVAREVALAQVATLITDLARLGMMVG
jgi:hypothetical protein